MFFIVLESKLLACMNVIINLCAPLIFQFVKLQSLNNLLIVLVVSGHHVIKAKNY